MSNEFAERARGRYFQIRPDGMIRAVTEDEFNKATEGAMTEGADRKLPQYQCHKRVYALKIAGLRPVVGGAAIITPAENGYAPFEVDHAYVAKHKPEIGGYYVVYEDGYKSYSPAKAFEEGYTMLPNLKR